MILVHVDDIFMAGKLETLKNIKEKIKEKFKISENRKVKNFLGVYYKWVHNAIGTYSKITIYKDVNKLVEVYEKYTRSDLKVRKTPGDLGMNISRSD